MSEMWGSIERERGLEMGFMECGSCIQKPGAAELCQSCIVNRAEIEKLEGELLKTKGDLNKARNLLCRWIGLHEDANEFVEKGLSLLLNTARAL